jgi:hypothetical protein
MQKKSESIRGHIAEFFKSGSIQDTIAGYQRNIQEICSRLKVLVNTLHFINLRIHHLLQLMAIIDTNFQVHEIKAALATGTSSSIMLICIIFIQSHLCFNQLCLWCRANGLTIALCLPESSKGDR